MRISINYKTHDFMQSHAIAERLSSFEVMSDPADLASLDQQIADFFSIPVQPFTTSISVAYDLLDDLTGHHDYLNVDYRIYDTHVLCDINEDTGNYDFVGAGSGYTSCRKQNRNLALVSAIMNSVTCVLETQRDEADD